MRRPVVQAASFLSPLGGPSEPTAAAVAWFPLVGAVLGAGLGGAWWLADRLWPPALAAALVVALDLALTGLLHLDGLVDAADGLLPHLDRERRLSVMAEPGAGAFGVGVAVAVLLVRWAALASMRPSPLLVAGVWCVSRTAMAATTRLVPYARNRGLATAFVGRGSSVALLAGGAAAVIVAAVGRGLVGVGAVATTAVGAGAVVAFGRRRLGGFTGDVLGAAGLVGETAGLVLAAARW